MEEMEGKQSVTNEAGDVGDDDTQEFSPVRFTSSALVLEEAYHGFNKATELVDLVEDVLIEILTYLDVSHLVRFQRVSKDFQVLTQMVIKRTKKAIDGALCEAVASKNGNLLEVIKKFGPDLKVLDISSVLAHINSLGYTRTADENVQHETIIIKLAKLFPNVEDFGPVQSKHLSDVINYAESFETGTCKLRNLVVINVLTTETFVEQNRCDVDVQIALSPHGKIISEILWNSNKIRQLCPYFNEFAFEFNPLPYKSHLNPPEHRFEEKPFTSCALWMLVLPGTVGFKTLTLWNEANYAIFYFLATINPANVLAVNVDLEELNLLVSDSDSVLLPVINREVVQSLVNFAPNIVKLSIWSAFEVTPLIAGFEKLEKLSLAIPFTTNIDSEAEELEKLFIARGAQLKELNIDIHDSSRPSKVELMIGTCCSKLEKLKIEQRSKVNLTELAKVTALTNLEFQAQWLDDGDIEVLFDKLTKLNKLKIYCLTSEQELQIDIIARSVRSKLMDAIRSGKRSNVAIKCALAAVCGFSNHFLIS